MLFFNNRHWIASSRFATLAVLAMTFFIASSAFAEPYTYAPEYCDMQVTFPEKPFIETKCLNKGNTQECSDIVTFKKIAPPDSSVTFRVTCVAYPKEDLDTYTSEVVEKTLAKLLSDQGMEAFDISSDDADGLRRSTSMSVGSKDNLPYIYTGQIWIGKQSMFTLEGHMKGPKNEQIESTFADILRKTYPVGLEQNKEKDQDKPKP